MKKNNVLLTLISLVIGIVIGFGFSSHYYKVGPFADLQAVPASARLNAGGSWSIKGTNFWISFKENCANYNAIDTGRTMTNPDTGEQYRECQIK